MYIKSACPTYVDPGNHSQVLVAAAQAGAAHQSISPCYSSTYTISVGCDSHLDYSYQKVHSSFGLSQFLGRPATERQPRRALEQLITLRNIQS